MGKNNGGHASFQAKRAQQVSCLSIIVVYIVLCSEKHATQRHLKASRVLNDLRTKTTQDRSVELRKPVLVSINFPHFSWANLSFCFHFLDLISKPIFVQERNDFARVTDWYPRRRLIAKLETGEEKKCGKGLLLVGWRRGLESPRRHFRPKKST